MHAVLCDLLKSIKMGEKAYSNLYFIVYDYFMQQYGIKKIAESKLNRFIQTAYQYKEKSCELKTYAILLGIDDERMKSTESQLNFYLNCILQLDES